MQSIEVMDGVQRLRSGNDGGHPVGTATAWGVRSSRRIAVLWRKMWDSGW